LALAGQNFLVAGVGQGQPARPSLWRNTDYIGWWTGNSISALGSSVSGIAYPLLVLYTTGSVGKAGTGHDCHRGHIAPSNAAATRSGES